MSGTFASAVIITCCAEGKAATSCKFPFFLEVTVCRIPLLQELKSTLNEEPALLEHTENLELRTENLVDGGDSLDLEK